MQFNNFSKITALIIKCHKNNELIAELWTPKKKLLIVNFLPDDEVGLSNIGIIMAIHQN